MQPTFGQWLRGKRLDANLSQEEVALALGFKRLQVYSNIERNKMALPMLKWPRICQILGIEYGELIEALRRHDPDKVAEYEEFVRNIFNSSERLIAS
jgi:transcriptional regulator with XRE-family HTH domain